MSHSSSANFGPDWATLLAEGKTVPASQAVELVLQLAEEVARLHSEGQFHGEIGVQSVSANRDLGGLLKSRSGDFQVTLDSAEWGEFLPELQRLIPPALPTDIAAARQRLRGAGIDLDPRQIDVCQIGALLCRLLTGESAGAYLRSMRVKGKVPPELRLLLENALGCDGHKRYADALQLVAALQSVGAPVVALADMPPTEAHLVEGMEPLGQRLSSSRAKDDTTPIAVSAGGEGSDTSVRPGGIASASPPAGAAPTSEPPLPFSRLAHYEVVGRIGRGGMGDVYRGYERNLDRTVAIKVLHADLARNDDFVRRFQAEATAVAKLNHPNIVPIFFIGEDQGHRFYVMQYVVGESLADLLARKGKLSVAETLPIVEQALAGLAATHHIGMVHRDIKPGNILLDHPSRRALLADFGLVKSLDSPSGPQGSSQTATGVIMETVDYISPEQGRGLAVDGRSDLYSLGVLLYRLLTGKLPFEADSPTALIFQHVYESPPSLREKAPEVPESLAMVVEKLLAKSPADRHQSADEVLADLQAIRSGESLPSQREKSSNRGTEIIRLPAFDNEAPIWHPDAPEISAKPDWWRQFQDRAKSFLIRNTPEALEHLQGTQLQMEGAVANYERRQRELQQLSRDADVVLNELRRQRSAQLHAAVAASNRFEAAENPETAERARDEQAQCERSAEQLGLQIAEQEGQIEPIQLKLAQVQAKLQQLRSQRDILKARLRTAEAQSPARRSGFGRVLVFWGGAAAAVMVAVVFLITVLYRSKRIEYPHSALSTVAVQNEKPAVVFPREVHVRVVIDGRDNLRFYPTGATWEHLGSDWPTDLDINGLPWNPAQAEQFGNAGPTEFMSHAVSFVNPELIVHKGRGTVKLVQDAQHNICVEIDDPSPGDDLYDFTIRFQPAASGDITQASLFPGSPALLSAPFDATQAKGKQAAWAKYLESPVDVGNLLRMKYMLIPPGSYTMGYSAADFRVLESLTTGPSKEFSEASGRLLAPAHFAEHNLRESEPPHRVTLTRPFYLSQTEVTRAQFREFIKDSGYSMPPQPGNWEEPDFPQEDDHPVVRINWYDAVAFCDWLSRKEGQKCRLPTEAEWEYACRAGTTTIWGHGSTYPGLQWSGNVSDAVPQAKSAGFQLHSPGDKLPNFVFPDGYLFTAPAGQYLPNRFGLLDMHGNVAEWCADRYQPYSAAAAVDPPSSTGGAMGVIRGGSWYCPVWASTSGYRLKWDLKRRTGDIGIRVLREIQPPASH